MIEKSLESGTLLEEVKRTYADCHLPWEGGEKLRRLQWWSPVVRFDLEAKDALRAIGGYNNFDAEWVIPALEFAGVRALSIGREYSVVLYLVGEGPFGRAWAEGLRKVVLADEVGAPDWGPWNTTVPEPVREHGNAVLRLWWD